MLGREARAYAHQRRYGDARLRPFVLAFVGTALLAALLFTFWPGRRMGRRVLETDPKQRDPESEAEAAYYNTLHSSLASHTLLPALLKPKASPAAGPLSQASLLQERGVPKGSLAEEEVPTLATELGTGGLPPGDLGEGPDVGQGAYGGHAAFAAAVVVGAGEDALFHATRALREGVPTVAILHPRHNASAAAPLGVAAATYPEDAPARSWAAGDGRAAMAPLLAARALATRATTFDWLFVAGARTLFFPAAAGQLTAGLDPAQPYFLSDNLWFGQLWAGAHHPNPAAPRCVPCGYNASSDPLGAGSEERLPEGCPCTPATLCGAGFKDALPAPPLACGIPRAPGRTYSIDWSSGFLLSRGLLAALDARAYESCVLSQYSTGADAFLTICLWEQGHAVTDPHPLWQPQGATAFDLTPTQHMEPSHENATAPRVARYVGHLMSEALGHCDGLCQLERKYATSLHMGGGALGREGPRGLTAALITSLVAHLRTPASFTRRPTPEEIAAAVAPPGFEGQVQAALVALQRWYARKGPRGGFLGSAIGSPPPEGPRQRPVASLEDLALAGAAQGVASDLLAAFVMAGKPFLLPPDSAPVQAALAQGLPSTADAAGASEPAVLPRRLSGIKQTSMSLSSPVLDKLAGVSPTTKGAPDYNPADFVVAIATFKGRQEALHASRPTRLGVRTFLATNEQPLPANTDSAEGVHEMWAFYPDDKPRRSFYQGDGRAAIVPFLAHRELGNSFKWLFYGDDDSLFFPEAAARIVQGLDPEVPYFLTDNMWYSGYMGSARHPHEMAPLCRPCHFNATNSYWPVSEGMPEGCPCTPEVMCRADTSGTLSQGGPQPCGIPRAPVYTYSMHGGAGALLSIGLFKHVDFDAVRRCIEGAHLSGGDSFITLCLWEAGYGMTHPRPGWHPRQQRRTLFDPSPPGISADDDIAEKTSHALATLLQAAAGVCQGLCELEAGHLVSLHLRTRRMASDWVARHVTFLLTSLAANRTAQPGWPLLGLQRAPDGTGGRAQQGAAAASSGRGGRLMGEPGGVVAPGGGGVAAGSAALWAEAGQQGWGDIAGRAGEGVEVLRRMGGAPEEQDLAPPARLHQPGSLTVAEYHGSAVSQAALALAHDLLHFIDKCGERAAAAPAPAPGLGVA